MRIDVTIDRLIVEGALDARQRRALGAAVETELARLLAASGLSPQWQGGGAVPRINTGTFAPSSDPAELGRGIARAVYGGIGRKP